MGQPTNLSQYGYIINNQPIYHIIIKQSELINIADNFLKYEPQDY